MDDEVDDDELAMQQRLFDLCRERAYLVAGDGSVCEAAAEVCLGLSRGCLRKRLSLGTLRIEHRTEGNRRWYRVSVLARLLCEKREK